jgi:phospholipase/carboxylesterase
MKFRPNLINRIAADMAKQHATMTSGFGAELFIRGYVNSNRRIRMPLTELNWHSMLSAIVRRPVILTNDPPILVLLHGLGADEHDLMGLADELDPRLLVVSIRAPLDYGNGGYAWFDIQWDASGVRIVPEQALLSLEVLVETLRMLPEALGVTPSQILLGGFSQGAMMSVAVAFADPFLISGVISMSGRLVPDFVPAEPLKETSDLPFLVQHGTVDGVLPVAGSRLMREQLEAMGCSVTYKEYPMAHEISRQSLADVRDWISKRLP